MKRIVTPTVYVIPKGFSRKTLKKKWQEYIECPRREFNGGLFVRKVLAPDFDSMNGALTVPKEMELVESRFKKLLELLKKRRDIGAKRFGFVENVCKVFSELKPKTDKQIEAAFWEAMRRYEEERGIEEDRINQKLHKEFSFGELVIEGERFKGELPYFNLERPIFAGKYGKWKQVISLVLEYHYLLQGIVTGGRSGPDSVTSVLRKLFEQGLRPSTIWKGIGSGKYSNLPEMSQDAIEKQFQRWKELKNKASSPR